MMVPRWHEEPITKAHDRKSFDSGDTELNHFLQRYARQGHECGSAKTFLAIEDANACRILGFYSIAPATLSHESLPDALRRGLARHDVPGFRLARLATDKSVQGQGIAGQLLVAAARRCIRAAQEVGGKILIIDAKNDRAARWYKSYGGIGLDDAPHTLVMALATFAEQVQCPDAENDCGTSWGRVGSQFKNANGVSDAHPAPIKRGTILVQALRL